MKAARALLIVCGLMLSGCGDSPGGPSTTQLELSGNWTGTWTFFSGGAIVTDTITMTVTQRETSATGQWSAAGGAGGTVAFTPAADFTGTASISQTLITGINCSASTTMTGTASSTQLRITFGPLVPTGLCQWSASNQFTLAR